MGTPLGPKYIPYTYMDPLGYPCKSSFVQNLVFSHPYPSEGSEGNITLQAAPYP